MDRVALSSLRLADLPAWIGLLAGLGAFLLCLAGLGLLPALARAIQIRVSPAAARQARAARLLASYRLPPRPRWQGRGGGKTQPVGGVPMQTVLVVDDSPEIRNLVAIGLRRQGFTVVGAAHGTEALALLDHTQVDLVVTDLQMPVVDGRELVRHLRAGCLAHLPIVLLTAGADPGTLPAVPGANVILVKPISPAVLAQTVSRLCAHSPARPGQPPTGDAWGSGEGQP